MPNEPIKCPKCGSGNLSSYFAGIKERDYENGLLVQETDWQDDSEFETFICQNPACEHQWIERS